MTALCGGGTSSIRPGIATFAVFGTASLASVLNNSGWVWAAVVAPYLGVLSYDLLNLCGTDPPAEPVITAEDVIALLTFGNLQAHVAAQAKLSNLIANLVWYQVCQCDVGPQPALPAPQAPPAGLPSVAPLVSGTGPGLPCLTATGQCSSSTNTGIYNLIANPNCHGDLTLIRLPPTGRDLRLTGSVTPAGASHSPQWNFSTRWYQGGPPSIVNGPNHPPDGVLYSDVMVSPLANPTMLEVLINGQAPATVLTDIAYAQADVFCGGAPTLLQPACCPADQYNTALLQQIVELVTLIQRQAVPFAYVPKALHVGLAGAGELAVQGLIGARITVTGSIPGTIGTEAGDPNVLFNLGWINWGSADGFLPREFLSGTTTLSLPPSAGAYTKLGYSLAPGVAVTIQELAREP